MPIKKYYVTEDAELKYGNLISPTLIPDAQTITIGETGTFFGINVREHDALLRFQLNIPPDATIRSAKIYLKSANTASSSSYTSKIYVFNVTNMPPLNENIIDGSIFTKERYTIPLGTYENIRWSNWQKDVWDNTGDISYLIRNRIKSAGWESGNFIGFCITLTPNDSGYIDKKIYSIESGLNNAPYLEIDYDIYGKSYVSLLTSLYRRGQSSSKLNFFANTENIRKIELECPKCDGVGLLTCADCDGNGEIICDECNGIGEIICSNCNGYGSCPDCDGNGGEDISVTCSSCDGSGNCPDCDGDGIIWENVACNECGGSGNCGYCDGSGENSAGNPCPYCNGSGICSFCDGTGYEAVETTCSSCSGSGDCSSCGGTGYIEEWEDCENCNGSGSCSECDGSGKVICPACNGSGIVTCDNCDGIGSITCDRCNGNKVVWGIQNTESFIDGNIIVRQKNIIYGQSMPIRIMFLLS